MSWFGVSMREWRRRPARTIVTIAGIAIAVAALFSMLAFHDGYRDGIHNEIDRLGAHVLVVPKGCPYDSASIALHGAAWPCYLKGAYLEEVRATPGVSHAAPAFMHAMYQDEGKQIVYVGVDENMLSLKPHWKIEGRFPAGPGELLAGAEVAEQQKWHIGQKVELPGLSNKVAQVAGIIQHGGGADDGFIYMRLADAQSLFQHPTELTHILVRLKDPNELDRAVSLLRGCDAGMDMNVVPMAHLFQTIQKLVGSTRLLLGSVAIVALMLALCGVVNAVLMAVAERTQEIGVMRALGASRGNIFCLVWLETSQVCAAGGIVGVAVAYAMSHGVEAWLRGRLPFAPMDGLIRWEWPVAGICVIGAIVAGSIAGLIPAWRAIRRSPIDAIRLGRRT